MENKKLFVLLLFFIIVSSFSVTASIKNGVVSYWSHDSSDIINNVSVDSFDSNNGSISGAKVNSSGKVSEALSFNNSEGDYIEVENNSNLDVNDSFTFVAWVNSKEYSNWQIIAERGDWNSGNYGIIVEKNSKGDDFRVNHKDLTPSYCGGSSDIDDGDWHFVAGVFNGSHVNVFVDGIRENKCSVSGTINSDSEKLYIGSRTKSSYFFRGAIDEVSLWDRSLNSSEIGVLYNRTKDEEYTYFNGYRGRSPLYNNFSTMYGSTNFSSVDDLTNVSNMTLAISNTKVNWNSNVNAKSQNYDKNVKLSQGLVSVNSSALDSTINSSATVSLDINSCGDFDIYKSNKPVDNLSELKNQGTVVGDETGCTDSYCSNVSCNSGELTYDVQHFSSTGSDSTSSTETVPEFSTYTLLLAVGITVLSFFFVRN